MSKKIISLLLCLIMLAGVSLVSCGDDEIAMSSPLDTRTLSMFVISDKTVFESSVLDEIKDILENPDNTPADKKEWADQWIKTWVPEGKTFDAFYEEQIKISSQYEAVEDAINLITKTQFSIQLNLTYLSEEDYYDVLDNNFALMADNKGNYTGLIKDSLAVENEDGVPEYVYPTLPEYHVDIFYIAGEDNFNKLYNDGRLASLSKELSSTYKPLTTLIYPGYIQAVSRYEGTTNNVYAIPNNIPTGEYKYMLVNKELADRYKINISDIKTWEDLEDYLSIVSKYEDNCVPILLPEGIESTNGNVALEDILSAYVFNNYYWSISYEETDDGYTYKVNPKDFSLLGSSYEISSTQNGNKTTWIPFDNMLNVPAYQSQLASLMHYNEKGYFASKADDGDKVAISVFEGNIVEAQQYKDDYYLVPLDVPRIEGDGAYKGMFAVSANTTELTKSMQIINYLSTDPEFRNLLQYGIEGDNYVLDDNGYPRYLESNLYNMDVEKTGNIFNAYAPDDTYATYNDKGELVDAWGLAKQVASDALIHPLFNFSIEAALDRSEYDGDFLKVDNSAIDYLNNLSDEYFQKILEVDPSLSITEIREQLRLISQELNTDATIIKLRDYKYSQTNTSDATSKGTSVYELYYKWMIGNGLAVSR